MVTFNIGDEEFWVEMLLILLDLDNLLSKGEKGMLSSI